MGKNPKMQQKKLKIPEKEKAGRPKKICKGNRKKESLRTLKKMGMTKKDWNDKETMETSSESTSSDSITGKSMHLAVFDLTLNERMNGLACWMTSTNDINFHLTFLQLLSNILCNMLDKMLDRFN